MVKPADLLLCGEWPSPMKTDKNELEQKKQDIVLSTAQAWPLDESVHATFK